MENRGVRRGNPAAGVRDPGPAFPLGEEIGKMQERNGFVPRYGTRTDIDCTVEALDDGWWLVSGAGLETLREH